MRTIVLHTKKDNTPIDVPINQWFEGSTNAFSTTIHWNDSLGDKHCEIVKESIDAIQAKINKGQSD